MSEKFVVALSCSSVREMKEPSKQFFYSFEITWSDDSTTAKEVSSEDLALLRRNLKTEVYKSKTQVVIPELPDGKVGGFASKAKKLEKRKKNIDEFCIQIINLPHAQGKLQVIASPFEASATDVVKIEPQPTELRTDNKSKTVSVQKSTPESGKENDCQMAPESRTKQVVESKKLTPDDDYQQILPYAANAKSKIPPRSNSKLNYVEVETIPREKRKPREVTSAVYAEVVLLKPSARSDWLKPILDPDDPDEEERPVPIVPPHASNGLREEANFTPRIPSPEETEVTETAEVLAPEPALEMSDSAESSLNRPGRREEDPGEERQGLSPGEERQGLFDAAMMSTFPDGTLIPKPPSQTPEKCPAASDIKLSKKELPKANVPNICVVAISGRKSSGDNTLPFKRKQRAHLLYTTDIWWFISTGESIGWVPADFWRIVTQDSKTVSGKAMPPYAPWNFGVLGRAECEALLNKTGNQLDFLIRKSANSTDNLVVSVKQDDRVHHFEIQFTKSGSYLIGHHHFKTIHNVILYYTKQPLFNDANGNGFRLGQLFVRPKK